MTEQDRDNERTEPSGSENETKDPGRTPGAAEGDRRTVEEDLRDKEGSEK